MKNQSLKLLGLILCIGGFIGTYYYYNHIIPPTTPSAHCGLEDLRVYPECQGSYSHWLCVSIAALSAGLIIFVWSIARRKSLK
jgi:hypothetical protein